MGTGVRSSYWAAGRVGEAIQLLEQVLADRVEVLGDAHPDTLNRAGTQGRAELPLEAGHDLDAACVGKHVDDDAAGVTPPRVSQ